MSAPLTEILIDKIVTAKADLTVPGDGCDGAVWVDAANAVVLGVSDEHVVLAVDGETVRPVQFRLVGRSTIDGEPWLSRAGECVRLPEGSIFQTRCPSSSAMSTFPAESTSI